LSSLQAATIKEVAAASAATFQILFI
jgi:hypothetical protein